MQAQSTTDDRDCELCSLTTRAKYHAPNYQGGVDVCGDHAKALEDANWIPGESYNCRPLTTGPDHSYVFVYGTLMNDTGYDAELTGWRRDRSGNFPTLVPDEDATVTGEVHKVTPDRLEQLDQIEGTPTLYKRLEIPLGVYVYIGDPRSLDADATYPFDREYLQERLDESALTLTADFDPRDMGIEGGHAHVRRGD